MNNKYFLKFYIIMIIIQSLKVIKQYRSQSSVTGMRDAANTISYVRKIECTNQSQNTITVDSQVC